MTQDAALLNAAILDNRGVLAIGGSEARTFLQGLITNDIDLLTSDTALYAALLSPQGKYLFDFFIVEQGDVLLLDTDSTRLPDLLKRLMMYRLRADVTLEDQSDAWAIAALSNPVDGLSDAVGAAIPQDGGIIFTDPRNAALGPRAILPVATAQDTLTGKGFSVTDATPYETRRIALGVPGSTDFIIDKTLALEGRFDELNAVSFKKGCYVGQELTARTKYRGNVRRKMFPVVINGPAPTPETDIKLGDKIAGEIRSTANDRGIALLRIEDVGKAAQENLSFTAGEATIRVDAP